MTEQWRVHVALRTKSSVGAYLQGPNGGRVTLLESLARW